MCVGDAWANQAVLESCKVTVGSSLNYVSKSNGSIHAVTVEKIEEQMFMVMIRFEEDRKVWKRVPYGEVDPLGQYLPLLLGNGG